MTAKQRIQDVYGFEFPEEFFAACDFISTINKDDLVTACEMRIGFPFKLHAGLKPIEHPRHPIWESRYYHDLPEFITLLHGRCDGSHWGYYFDSPLQNPPVVAHYWHSDTFEHKVHGKSIFETIRFAVETAVTEFDEMIEADPDESYDDNFQAIERVRAELRHYWGSDRPEIGNKYLDTYAGSGLSTPTVMTRDGLGITVPKGMYKKLSGDPFKNRDASVELRRSDIEPLIQQAMGHLKQGKPGSALKLGRELWIFAADYPESYDLLDSAYMALGREPLRRLLHEARAFRLHCDHSRP